MIDPILREVYSETKATPSLAFAVNMTLFMKVNGITGNALAARSGIPQKTLWATMNAKSVPSIDMCKKICDALYVDMGVMTSRYLTVKEINATRRIAEFTRYKPVTPINQPLEEREMGYQIEKDVPLPPTINSKHHELRAVCHSMEVGDSLLLDSKLAQTALQIIQKVWDDDGTTRQQRKAATRKEGSQRRVWRIQ